MSKKSKKSKKRLGYVQFNFRIAVDMENAEMVDHAKDAILDDLLAAYKNNEIGAAVLEVVEDKTLTKGDIPEFLIEDHADWITSSNN